MKSCRSLVALSRTNPLLSPAYRLDMEVIALYYRRMTSRNHNALLLCLAFLVGCGGSDSSVAPPPDFTSFEWTLINADAPWEPRAGLHVVPLNGRFYLMGGRTPLESEIIGASTIWADVWVSDDAGASWKEILDTDAAGHWPARAYFQAVTKGGDMYVLGGQDFQEPPVPSNFYNDVWRSSNGVDWEQLTADAGWAARAGSRAVTFKGEIYIFGGSVNDDPEIVGGPPQRIYFNDVWKSADGATWTEMTPEAPWEKRAGAVVVVKDDFMFLLGGEAGFVGPYFNDVWRSADGENWELVTPSAGWSPRPGHQCAVVSDNIVCFGGFGLTENPSDVWVSPDGATWEQVSDSPWNATSPDEIKYDFEAFSLGGAIYTFGGDRETFDFPPDNYLRVDNDVWKYAPPTP